jgi:hypothetical protein
MRCARVYDDRIIEIHEPRDQLTGRFHPDYVARLVDIPDDAQINWVLHDGKWLADLPSPPAQVPEMVTNYQARAALLQVGLFVTVDAMIKAMEPTQPAFQAWEFANNFYRNSEFINTLGAGLGLSSTEIDDLFILAASIDG